MAITLRTGDSVLLDTAPLYHYWHQSKEYCDKLDSFFTSVYDLNIHCTATMQTYTKLLLSAMQQKQYKIAAKCRNFLTNSKNFSIYPLSLIVADKTAFLMSRHNLRYNDATKLATAEICGVNYILTDNKSWPEMSEIQYIFLDDLQTPS
jgi:predicted nucleic acid-binding protein